MNDSKATNVAAARRALAAYAGDPVHLILGGFQTGLSARAVFERASRAIVGLSARAVFERAARAIVSLAARAIVGLAARAIVVLARRALGAARGAGRARSGSTGVEPLARRAAAASSSTPSPLRAEERLQQSADDALGLGVGEQAARERQVSRPAARRANASLSSATRSASLRVFSSPALGSERSIGEILYSSRR